MIFTGYRRDALQIMDASEITYLPSCAEGLPNVIIESFIISTPVIANDIPPIRELIEDGVNGYLIRNNNVDEYVIKTRELLDNEEKRRRFSINGRNKMERMFSKKVFIDESIAALKKAFEYFKSRK